MDFTGEMKKKRAELLKEKEKIENVLKGVEAYLEAVGVGYGKEKKREGKQDRETVQSLPRKVVQRNVPRGAIEAVKERESVFTWDGKE